MELKSEKIIKTVIIIIIINITIVYIHLLWFQKKNLSYKISVSVSDIRISTNIWYQDQHLINEYKYSKKRFTCWIVPLVYLLLNCPFFGIIIFFLNSNRFRIYRKLNLMIETIMEMHNRWISCRKKDFDFSLLIDFARSKQIEFAYFKNFSFRQKTFSTMSWNFFRKNKN